MAGKIKGITIEFNGDTTKLDKALRQVAKDAKSVDAELRQVEKALKFNPKNVELLAQKQTLLKEKVDATDKSLKQLKDLQRQMDAKGVDKNSAEYRKLQREIITTESKLKHFQGELTKLGNVKLTALGRQLEDVGKKAKSAGDTMTKYVTGPIVAAGAASGAAFEGMAGSLAIITRLTGATGEDLKEFQAIFEDMSKTVPADMDSIATAIGEVNTRFGLTGDALQNVSTLFVEFADINGADLITSIDGVQKAMASFGVSTEETEHVLDVLTKVSQNTGVSVDRLYQGLVSNGTAFQEMNLTMDQAAILMGQLEKSGVNAETATNGLRKALKNAAADGIPFEEELKNVQDAILNAETSTEGLQAAYDVFGKSGDQMYAAIKSGALDLTALADASIDAKGAVEDTFEGTLTPAKRFQVVMNELKMLGYSIANTVLPYVNKALQKIIAAVEKVNKKWQTLSPGTQKAIIAVVGAIALIGPALSIAGRAVQAFGVILQNAGRIIGGVSKAISFFAANPIVLLIAGIAALVAAFVILWNKSEAFRNFFINMWNGIKTSVLAIIAAIKVAWNSVVTTFSAAVSRIRAVWSGIASFFSGLWSSIRNTFAGVVSFFSNAFGNAWQAIKSKFAGWGQFWSGLWQSVKNKFSDIGSAVGNAITSTIKGAINAIIGKIESVINSGIRFINSGLEAIDKYVPGKQSWRLKELNLPKLAEGGVLNGARAVIAGEAGPEAIIPLDKLFRQMDKMANTIAGTGEGVTVNVYATPGMDIEELTRRIEERIITSQKRRRLAWQ